MMLTAIVPVQAAEDKTVAHWKLQNNAAYYTGSLDNSDLTFKDLTGNGNDLFAAFAGEGEQLVLFQWDVGATTSDSSLLFGNTWDAAKSVDPYPAEKTN